MKEGPTFDGFRWQQEERHIAWYGDFFATIQSVHKGEDLFHWTLWRRDEYGMRVVAEGACDLVREAMKAASRAAWQKGVE